MAAQDLLNNIGGFIEGFQGLQLMSDGADMALSGAKYNADLYRMAATSSLDMAEYNVALTEINNARIKDAMAKEYSSIRSKNTAAWSTSGFSYASGSYISVQNKVQSAMEHKLIQQKNNEIIQKQNIRYEGQAAAVNYENQARSAEYQGQVAAYQSEVQQSQAFGKMFTNALSFLMS